MKNEVIRREGLYTLYAFAYFMLKLSAVQVRRANLIDCLIKLNALKDKTFTSDIMHDLLTVRGLSMEEVKFYYLFLDAYLDESLDVNQRQEFFSKNGVIRVIREKVGRIKEMTGEIFLSSNQKTLMEALEGLLEKGYSKVFSRVLITRDTHKHERDIYPDLFKTAVMNRRTWSLFTYQPARQEDIKINRKTGKSEVTRVPFLILADLDNTQSVPLKTVRDLLGKELLALPLDDESRDIKEREKQEASEIRKYIHLSEKKLIDEIQRALRALGLRILPFQIAFNVTSEAKNHEPRTKN